MLARSLLLAALCALAAHAADPNGEALFKQRCAGCHEGNPQPRMPSRQQLSARTPESVYQAMFGGVMAWQAAGLSPEEGRAISRFVTGKEFGSRSTGAAGKCSAPPAAITIGEADWNGWGNDPGNTRFQSKPGLTAADVPNLKLKWAFDF